MSSFALDSPSSRVARCVPPAPGMMPSLVSGSPSLVTLLLATRRSHARVSSQSPPSAGSSIATMVGARRAEYRAEVGEQSRDLGLGNGVIWGPGAPTGQEALRFP